MCGGEARVAEAGIKPLVMKLLAEPSRIEFYTPRPSLDGAFGRVKAIPSRASTDIAANAKTDVLRRGLRSGHCSRWVTKVTREHAGLSAAAVPIRKPDIRRKSGVCFAGGR